MSGDKRREHSAGTWTNEHTGTHWDNTMNATEQVREGSVSTRPGGVSPHTLEMRRMGAGSVGFVATADGVAGQVHGFNGQYHQKYGDRQHTHRALSPRSQEVMRVKQQAVEAMEASRRSEREALARVDRTGFSPMQERRPRLHGYLMSTSQPAASQAPLPAPAPVLLPMHATPQRRPSSPTLKPPPRTGGAGHGGQEGNG